MSIRDGTKWPIPDDWEEENDGFMCYALCVPNSRGWRTIIDGLVSELMYGRNWERSSGSIKEAQDMGGEVFESMCAVRCDDLGDILQCICDSTSGMKEIMTVQGQSEPVPPSDGTVVVGPGEQFPDQASYFDAKCNVANAIYDTVIGLTVWLKQNGADVKAGAFGGVTSGLVVGLALAGPAGWAVAVAGGSLVSLSGFLIAEALDFSDVELALGEVHQECVLSLYNAGDSGSAESEFLSAVDNATQPISVIERAFLALTLSTDMLNQLFDPREDMANYNSPSPIDCGSSLLAIWTFQSSDDGWVFRDDSAGSSSASGTYQASLEALQVENVTAGGSGQPISRGTWIKTGLSIAVPAGGSVQFDYSAPSDEVNQSKWLKVIYSDVSEDSEAIYGGTSAGTLVMTVSQSKTINDIECSISRTWTRASVHTSEILEVRVYGV